MALSRKTMRFLSVTGVPLDEGQGGSSHPQILMHEGRSHVQACVTSPRCQPLSAHVLLMLGSSSKEQNSGGGEF